MVKLRKMCITKHNRLFLTPSLIGSIYERMLLFSFDQSAQGLNRKNMYRKVTAISCSVYSSCIFMRNIVHAYTQGTNDYLLFQFIFRVSKCTVGTTRAASFLGDVTAHTCLILDVLCLLIEKN